MYVTDFRANVLDCKDCKINSKTLVLFTFCCHATTFSSLGTPFLLSYINLQCRKSHLRTWELLGFISRQWNIKTGVIELFPVRGKQNKHVLKKFLVTYTV